MALAPSLKELKSKGSRNITNHTREGESMDDQGSQVETRDLALDGVVEFNVMGLGGAGKVAALRYAKRHPNASRIITVDTSGVVQKNDNVESFRIAGLNGSAKLRKENIDQIKAFTTDFVSTNTFSDVNVLIFSAAGGSGSVLGPVILSEIARQGKVGIVVSIIDMDSEVDIINSLNLLRTVDNIAKDKGSYVPVVLFDNSKSRSVVDTGIDSTIDNIDEMLSTPLVGLDRLDRLRFLNPTAFDGVSAGMKLMNLSRLPDGDWEDNGQYKSEDGSGRIDAALIISKPSDHLVLTQRCVVTFRGYFGEDYKSNLIGSIGYTIPDSLVKLLNSSIHSHKSTAPAKETVIKSEYTSVGVDAGGGIIL